MKVCMALHLSPLEVELSPIFQHPKLKSQANAEALSRRSVFTGPITIHSRCQPQCGAPEVTV